MDLEKIKGKTNARTVTIFVLVILALIFILQNMTEAPFRLLFITITMPALILYALLLGIGFLVGFLFAGRKDK